MAIDKIFDGSVDGIADNLFNSVSNSVSEIKAMQQRKAAENVQLVVQALKKIDADIRQKYDSVTETFDKRISNIKDGQDGKDGKNGHDGLNGKDGRDGKDGRNGRDGATGPRGFDGPKGLDGKDGKDGEDGISVISAYIDFDGSLVISLSSGELINVGEVVSPDIAEKIKVITNGGGTSQTVLDTLASLQAQINAITTGLTYKGLWNASTNSPTLASSTGTNGFYYVVSVSGSTNLNGITDWQVGDWAIYNGTVWQKIDQTNLVTSVAGRTGAVTLSTGDISGLGTIATQNSSNVSITGGSITGITDLAIADGGTGQSTAAAAITALTGTQTSGYYLRSNGTNASLSAIQAADVPTLNQNTTGSAASLSATNPVSRGGTNLTTLTNKGVLYASSTSQVATGTALQFDGTNFGMGATPSSWGSTYRAIEIGAQTALSYESNGSIKSTSLATNSYNATNTGARPYYKENGLATQYQQNVGEHAWYTAPTGIAGSSTTITTGKIYTNLTAGNQADFGAANGLVGTIWTATSTGTLTSGTVVQNIDFVESMRIDAYGYVKIGSLIASKAVFTDSSKNLVSIGTVGIDQGGTGATTAANARTNLGATTVGANVFTLTNPSAITFPRFNADNTVSALDAATFRTAIGAGTSSTSGTVTSVAITVPSILSVSGSPITSSGTFAISLSGTALPVGNGGTGQTTSIAALNALLPTQTGNANKYLQTDGTNASWDAVSLSTSDISGTLGTTNGGTGLTSFTANGVVYASSTSALATGSALTFDGTNFVNGSGGIRAGTNSGSGGVLSAWGGASGATIDITPSSASGANGVTYNTSFISGGSGPHIFSIGGTEQLRLTSTSLYTASGINVGIGTTSPAYKLDVNGAVNGKTATFTNISDNVTTIKAQYTTDGTSVAFFKRSDNAFSAVINVATTAPFGGTQVLDIGSDASGKSAVFNGNVGIGTSSPSFKLDVTDNTTGQQGRFNSSSANGTSISLTNTATNGRNYRIGSNFVNGLGEFSIYDSTASAERLQISSSGNLGLGVAPSAWGSSYKALQFGSGAIAGFSTTALDIYGNAYDSGTGAWKYLNSSQGATRYAAFNAQHQWFNAPSGTAGNAITFTQALTLDASGFLMLGTTTALRRLTVESATAPIAVRNSGSTAGKRWDIGPEGSSNTFVVYNQDSVGVYITDGGTSWTANSDERLKDIIEPISDAANKVASLRAVIGKYKTDAEGTRRSFLIAQDVQSVLPEAVSVKEDEIGTLGVQYSEVIPLLVAAIKELKAEFDEYKATHP